MPKSIRQFLDSAREVFMKISLKKYANFLKTIMNIFFSLWTAGNHKMMNSLKSSN